MKTIFGFFILVAVAAHADAKKKCFPLPTPVVDPPAPVPTCPKNEEYSECGANGCQSTCANPTLNQVCKATCIAGCVCKEGYLRDSNKKCVLAKNCPQIGDPPVDPPVKVCSKKHESYTTCGTACPLTCDKPTGGICTMQCVEGCFCDAGYVRNDKGNCVKVEDCPKSDPPVEKCSKKFESYTTCGTACPLTCDKPKPGPCTKQCVKGCFCDAGYVRNDKGDCVKVEDCPKSECKKFEIFSDCAPEACKKTCDTLDTACRAPCVPGCKCPEGLVYEDDSRNACIAPEKCPQIVEDPPACTKTHETFTDCGTACPLTCENVNNPPMFCTANCVVGCFCDEGYVRANDGSCVLPADCPVAIIFGR